MYSTYMGIIAATTFIFALQACAVGEHAYPPLDLDQYGGAKTVVGEATGWFSIQEVNGRQFLVTPEGHGMFSLGVVHISQGTSQEIFKSKYHSNKQAYNKDVVKNIEAWGFNSAGYGCTYKSDVAIADEIPFFVSMEILQTSGWLGGAFKFEDVFDPAFISKTKKEIGEFCQPVAKNKNLVGYYLTDIPNWRLDKKHQGQNWLSFYRSLLADSAGKSEYVDFLIEQHGDVKSLASAYGIDAGSKEDLLAMTEWDIDEASEVVKADDTAFLGVIAGSYYKLCHDTIREVDANHLIFGDRYFRWDYPDVVIRAALPYIDALAMQPTSTEYEQELFDGLYEKYGKPLILCDFAVNFKTDEYSKVMWGDYGDKLSAAQAYARYIAAATDAKYMLGIHRCTYIDLTKSNGMLKQGLVRQDGSPYEQTVKLYAHIHEQAYQKLYHGSTGKVAAAEIVAVKASDWEQKAKGGWNDFPPEATIDGKGDANSSWRVEIHDQSKGQWIQYDLGSVKNVDSIDIQLLSGDQRRYSFDIAISTDGKDWQEIWSGKSSGSEAGFDNYSIGGKQARFVRLTGYGNEQVDGPSKFPDWFNVVEVKVLVVR